MGTAIVNESTASFRKAPKRGEDRKVADAVYTILSEEFPRPMHRKGILRILLNNGYLAGNKNPINRSAE